jgi:hypothetical protein
MKMMKRLITPAVFCWVLGFLLTPPLPARGGVPPAKGAVGLHREVPEIHRPGAWLKPGTNILGTVQGIDAIGKLGGFMGTVLHMQAEGFLDASTADALNASSWSMIDHLVAAVSTPSDCHSIPDLIDAVNATTLQQRQKNQLIWLLNGAQTNIDQGQAFLKAGEPGKALCAQFAAIRKLGEFIERVDQFEQQTLLDRPTAASLENCAMYLVGTVNVDMNSGLVASYPFNGDARDVSGNGNNGSVIGATFQTYGAGGKMALRFSGNTSSYVLVPRSASLEPVNAISIAMWVKGVPGQPCGYGWGTILRKANDCQPGYFMRGCNHGTAFQLDGADPCGSPSYHGQASLPTFTGTNWQHIVATYSRTNGSIKCYANGALLDQSPLAVQLLHTGDLYIGGAAVAGDDGGFNGLINDVQIYSRALSAADVQQLYLSGSSSHP